MEDAIAKAKVLIEALPYLKSFDDKIFVVKIGGAALAGGGEVSDVIQDIVFLQQVGIKPVVVHGGGPHISEEIKSAAASPDSSRATVTPTPKPCTSSRRS